MKICLSALPYNCECCAAINAQNLKPAQTQICYLTSRRGIRNNRAQHASSLLWVEPWAAAPGQGGRTRGEGRSSMRKNRPLGDPDHSQSPSSVFPPGSCRSHGIHFQPHHTSSPRTLEDSLLAQTFANFAVLRKTSPSVHPIPWIFLLFNLCLELVLKSQK